MDNPGDANAIDLDNDGDLDVVAAVKYTNFVKICFNLGGGAFSSVVAVNMAVGPEKIVFGDFNRDGKKDIACCAYTPYGFDHQVSVILGNGNGTFQPEARYTHSALTDPTHIEAADVDQDGHVDLLVSNYRSNDISFFANRGDGTFEPHIRYGVSTNPQDFRYADFTGDGLPDIAAVCSIPLQFRSAIVVLRGIASCTYSLSSTSQYFYLTGGEGSVAITSSNGCSWNATSNANWITITSSACGIGNGSVTFSIAPNIGKLGRKASIIIGGKTFVVKQKGS